MSERFDKKVVFITGGTSGIGLATAVEFAREGAAHVIVTGRSYEKWQHAQTYIKQQLSKEQAKHIEYISCDIRVESQVQETLKMIYDKYGHLDIAFNNAGVQPGDVTAKGNIEDFDFKSELQSDGSIAYILPTPQPKAKTNQNDEHWREEIPTQSTAASHYRESPIATNILGTFYCLKWEIAYTFSRQPKDLPVSIINTSSRVGTLPAPSRPLYSASKAFINSLTRSLSNQVAQRANADNRSMVRVNAVAPGPVDTPLERAAFPGKSFETAKAGVPMQRIAEPEDIAGAVLFLADNNMSNYITGAILPVDGGHVAAPIIKP
ncbi:SDR family oxidoreductase [Thiotrichales bacterium 19S3-7]|nr:SDR family oxidoreductase [Thiotrichales bacterium 19S3-7]MCF6801965.1 SDR family oxidoreductase [Thiotrichales bacterium 19S3-11]